MREESWSLAGDCVLTGTLYVPDEYATAMIALHGFTGNRHSLKSYCRVLCQDKLVLALDQRGHGKSEGKVDIAAMARDIGRILDDMRERGASSVALLGHSMGGLVATIAAAEFPVSSLTVISAAVDPKAERDDRAKDRALLGKVLSQNTLGGIPRLNDLDVEGMMARFAHAPGALDYAQRVRCPYLSFHGTRDDIIPLWAAQRVYDAMGSGTKELVVLDGTHDLWVTHVSDILSRLTGG